MKIKRIIELTNTINKHSWQGALGDDSSIQTWFSPMTELFTIYEKDGDKEIELDLKELRTLNHRLKKLLG